MEPKFGMYGTWDMKSKMMRSSNLTEVTRARSVDHRCLFQAMGMSKVDKGVVLGVAQTLGTEYFPAALRSSAQSPFLFCRLMSTGVKVRQ